MKYLLLISLMLAHTFIYAQKMPDDYFEEASQSFESGDYSKALEGYRYVVDNHPRNELYPRAYYNMGLIYSKQKKYELAIPVFTSILKSNFNETEKLGGNIMDDPYANYRHRASEMLTDIYQQKKMYDSALFYLVQADSVYPYLHFCGNEYAANAVNTALQYAAIYKNLNKSDQAITVLLPLVFETLSNNAQVIGQLQILLKNRKGLVKELDQALDKIYAHELKVGDRSYTNYYFRFLDTEIPVSRYYEKDKKEALREMKASDFYQMIRRL
jgi:tetratricopeptide (TPR) repeat protein